MTFDSKRAELLRRFDRRVSELRAIVADPLLVNDLYPKLRDATDDIHRSINELLKLNQAENS